jgi:predicted Zn finger-like uncharacterized protein
VANQTFTRCPGCGTVFRVTASQLALREGQVRCGHCRAVFDANDHLLALDARRGDDADMPDELAAGRPTITLRSADALEAVDAPPAQPDASASEPGPGDADEVQAPATEPAAPGADAPAPESAEPTEPTKPTEPEAAPAHEPIDMATRERARRFEWKPRKSLRERPKTVYGAAMGLLLAALALQAVLEYRDALAAHAPLTRPLLQAVCDVFGCTIDPLRDSAALSIEASDLQADPGHRGLLLLSATIRNRENFAIAFPYLELTLTDSSDQVVVRRAFAPAEYVGGTSNPDAGIPGDGEQLVRLFVDASATAQAGYRLYLFYP